METKTSVYLDSNSRACFINEVSNCPICKHAIKPLQLFGYAYNNNSSKPSIYKLSFTYLCKACDDTFIVQYDDAFYNSTNSSFSGGRISSVAPNKFVSEKFDELIKGTSQSFEKIYNQALSAEHSGLDEIAGIGYRKALEFLIKDFLVAQYPEKKESIEKTQLGGCISNFIENPQLKTAASRATWLGNDQTHYIQKFTDKDVTDLKRLIRLTVHWISMILETEIAASMDPVK